MASTFFDSPTRRPTPRRHGFTAVQTALVLVLIATAVVAGVRSMGSMLQTDMNDTAARVGNPAALAGKFTNSGYPGSGSGGNSGNSGSGNSGSGDSGSGGDSSGDGGLCP